MTFAEFVKNAESFVQHLAPEAVPAFSDLVEQGKAEAETAVAAVEARVVQVAPELASAFNEVIDKLAAEAEARLAQIKALRQPVA